MANVHGKNTFVSLDGDDLSPYGTSVEWAEPVDEHDVTTFGQDAHILEGGLEGGSATLAGIYDNTAAVGPAAVIRPLKGTVVELIHRPEGTGAGRPQRTVDVLVRGYTESSPVADMVTWTADLGFSGQVADSTQ